MALGASIAANGQERDLPTTYAFDKRDIFVTQYRSLPELLQRRTQQFPVLTGGFGQFDGIRLLGASPWQLALVMGNRPLADPRGGSVPLELLSVEDIGEVAIKTGAQAIGESPTPTLQALAIEPAQFNHATPYIRWWYTQGAGDMLATDVTLSQNLADGTNVTLGVRRAGGNGVFQSTGYDVWNIRAMVRHALTDVTSIVITYNGASFNTDVWGGVRDEQGSSLSPSLAIPVYVGLRDEHRRHDLAISIANVLSNHWSVRTTLWAQRHDLLRLRPSSFSHHNEDTTLGNVFRSLSAGATMLVNGRWNDVTLTGGASLSQEQSDDSPWFQQRQGNIGALHGLASIPLGRTITFGVSGRLDAIYGTVSSGVGGQITIRPDTNTSIALDIANGAERLPATLFVTEPTYQSTLINVNARNMHDWGSVRILAWYRHSSGAPRMIINRVSDVVSGGTIPFSISSDGRGEQSSFGAVVSGMFSIGMIRCEPTIRAEHRDEQNLVSTDVQGEVRVLYRYSTGSNWVDIGLRGIVFGPTMLDRWVAPSWIVVRDGTRRNWVTNGLDAELVARVGNASVRLSYENMFGQPFTTIAMAPAFGGNFRLSLTWAFFD